MRLATTAALVGLLALSLAAAPAWTRIVTPHFVISGDVDEGRLRTLAVRLEAFRPAIAQLLPGARVPTLVPVFVVVFDTEREFTPFKPRIHDKPAPVSGYVVNEPFTPCIALRLDGSAGADLTVFHEYAHLLLHSLGSHSPMWFDEGAADFYSTLAVASDGSRVRVGRVVEHDTAALRQVMAHGRRLIPVAELLAATRDSAWTESDLQVFYAESWALVHYLLLGNPARTPQLQAFLDAVNAGTPAAQAFDDTLGPVSLVERELLGYVRANTYTVRDVPLSGIASIGAVAPRRMSEAEVNGALGRLLVHLRRDDEAAERLLATNAADASVLDAQLGLGLLRMRQDRPAEAVGPLQRAAELEPGNPLVAYDYALAALNAYNAAHPRTPVAGPPDPTLERAHTALQQAVPETRSAEALGVLGALEARLGRLAPAEQTLRRALALAPGRLPVMVELANVYIRLGKTEEALRLRVEIDAIRRQHQQP